MPKLTRQEIEMKLEEKYLGRIVSITIPSMRKDSFGMPIFAHKKVSGKIQKLAVESHTREPIVGFDINGTRYKCDVNYFIENITVHGSSNRGSAGDQGVQKGD